MSLRKVKVGSWVIYTKDKTSVSPGKRAKEILPAEKGDAYSYLVDKYWVVKSIDGNALTLVTRRGKENVVPLDDPRLRLPSWWELLFHRGRFPQLDISS